MVSVVPLRTWRLGHILAGVRLSYTQSGCRRARSTAAYSNRSLSEHGTPAPDLVRGEEAPSLCSGTSGQPVWARHAPRPGARPPPPPEGGYPPRVWSPLLRQPVHRTQRSPCLRTPEYDADRRTHKRSIQQGVGAVRTFSSRMFGSRDRNGMIRERLDPNLRMRTGTLVSPRMDVFVGSVTLQEHRR